jgi:hypothetical protein
MAIVTFCAKEWRRKNEKESERTQAGVVKKQSVATARVLYTGWLLCQKEDDRGMIFAFWVTLSNKNVV